MTAHDTDDVNPVPDALGAAATLPSQKRRAERRQRERSSVDTPVETSDDVQVFESHAATRQQLGPYLRLFWARRAFMAELARSNVRGKHANTALGSLWGVLDPLFMAALYYFLFTVIRSGAGRPVEFLPALVAGIFLFTLTTTALNEGGKSVTKSSALMLNSSFPRAVLPVSMVYKGLLAFVPTVGVYVVIYAVVGEPPTTGMFALPVLFAIQTVLNLGLALLFSTLIVFFRDLENALRYIQRLLFFTTPVIWPVALAPDRIRDILEWTPLFPIFASYQRILTGGSAEVDYIVRGGVWALAVFVIGVWLFLRYERAMAARL